MRHQLLCDHPIAAQLKACCAVTGDDIAVVEEVLVQPNLMLRVDFRREQLGFLHVDISGPAIDAIPVFADGGAVVELHFDRDRKDEVAFAMEADDGPILTLVMLAGIFPPCDRFAVGGFDLVVEYLGAVDGLVEVGAQVESFTVRGGDLFDSPEKIFARRVSEAIAHEVGVERQAHGILADDRFEHVQNGRCLTVGDAGVAVAGVKLPGKAGHGIVVRRSDVVESLIHRITQVEARIADVGSLFAEQAVEDFDLGVGVDAFVEPCLLKLIGSHHSVPILMAKLVLGDDFVEIDLVGNPPERPGGNQGRVFHAEHFGARFGIDQGHLFVRKRPVPLIKFLHRVFENIEVALGLAGVA